MFKTVLLVAFIFLSILFGTTITGKLIAKNDVPAWCVITFAVVLTGVATHFVGIW